MFFVEQVEDELRVASWVSVMESTSDWNSAAVSSVALRAVSTAVERVAECEKALGTARAQAVRKPIVQSLMLKECLFLSFLCCYLERLICDTFEFIHRMDNERCRRARYKRRYVTFWGGKAKASAAYALANALQI